MGGTLAEEKYGDRLAGGGSAAPPLRWHGHCPQMSAGLAAARFTERKDNFPAARRRAH